MNAKSAILAALTLLTTASCVWLPRQSTRYDADCGVETRHVELEAYQVAPFVACQGNDACAVELAVYSLVSATSLVVSGSVTVVGNAVYWVQHKARCAGLPPAAADH